MKHLQNMQASFPRIPSRDAIMGISTFNQPLPVMGGSKDRQSRESRSVQLHMNFTVRPHLQPCFSTILSVPLSARTRDVLVTAWDALQAEREKHGLLWGPLPSEDVADYMLCFIEKDKGDGPPGTIADIGSLALSGRASSSAGSPRFSSVGMPDIPALDVSDPTPRATQERDKEAAASQESAAAKGPNLDRTFSTFRRMTTMRGKSFRSGRMNSQRFSSVVPPAENMIEHDEEEVDAGVLQAKSLSRVGVDRCEEIPPNAFLSRVVRNTSKDNVGPHGCPVVHLVLRPHFFALENVIFSEAKTRDIILNVHEESLDALLSHERIGREMAGRAEERRIRFEEACCVVEQREDKRRCYLVKQEDDTFTKALDAFYVRFRELEVGMIAQWRKITTLRAEHEATMKSMVADLRGQGENPEEVELLTAVRTLQNTTMVEAVQKAEEA